MAPKMKKTSGRKLQVQSDYLITENELENEKENKYSTRLVLKEEMVKEPSTTEAEKEKLEGNQLMSPRLKPNMTVKPLGFWSKKLQDLEERITNKKCELYYEFSGTDESEFSYKTKKKPKQKAKRRKKKKAAVPVYKPLNKMEKVTEKKIKQSHRQSICREQIMLTKERKKLADKGKKFTFSTGMPSLGITSTPAAKNDNLVGASNFLFISPIIMGENENSQFEKCSPLKDIQNNSCPKDLDPETPKAVTKLKSVSCRRILRSGKIIGM